MQLKDYTRRFDRGRSATMPIQDSAGGYSIQFVPSDLASRVETNLNAFRAESCICGVFELLVLAAQEVGVWGDLRC